MSQSARRYAGFSLHKAAMLLRWLKPVSVTEEMKENLIRFAFVLSIVSLISMAAGWLKPQPFAIFADVAMIVIFIYAEVRERIMRDKSP